MMFSRCAANPAQCVERPGSEKAADGRTTFDSALSQVYTYIAICSLAMNSIVFLARKTNLEMVLA